MMMLHCWILGHLELNWDVEVAGIGEETGKGEYWRIQISRDVQET